MPKIKLIGELHPELTIIGLKAGDEKEARVYESNGVANFEHYFQGTTYYCSIWPDNYLIIQAKAEK